MSAALVLFYSAATVGLCKGKQTWPVYMPSLAMKVWTSCLYRYGCKSVSKAFPARLEAGYSYVAESDLGKRSAYNNLMSPWLSRGNFDQVLTTTGIVDNLLHDASNISIALSLHGLAHVLRSKAQILRAARRRTYVVEGAELGRGLVQAGVGGKDRAATFTLVSNDPTHGDGVWWRA